MIPDGCALLDADGLLTRTRASGKVKELADAIHQFPVKGATGLAHTAVGQPMVALTERQRLIPIFPVERIAGSCHNGIIE